jgi:hypothetical protein
VQLPAAQRALATAGRPATWTCTQLHYPQRCRSSCGCWNSHAALPLDNVRTRFSFPAAPDLQPVPERRKSKCTTKHAPISSALSASMSRRASCDREAVAFARSASAALAYSKQRSACLYIVSWANRMLRGRLWCGAVLARSNMDLCTCVQRGKTGRDTQSCASLLACSTIPESPGVLCADCAPLNFLD